MFFWVIKQIIVSFLIIAIMHYLYDFFKTNLTIPKVKDLVYKPKIQYKEIYKVINKNTNEQDSEQIDMKNELKEYLQSLSDTKTNLPFENLQSGQPLNQFQLGGQSLS